MPTDFERPIQRILFIRSDRMGDVLMNLPAVRLLRQNYPKAWITWMADRSVAPLLRNHPDVDEIFELDSLKIEQDGAYRKQLLDRVRKIHFDLAVASNASKFFHWLLFRSGAPLRVGWRRKWGFLLNRTLPDDKERAARHEIDSNLALVSLVSKISWDGSWKLPVDSAAQSAVEKRLSRELADAQSPVVAVHAGSSNPGKRWPLDRFAKVCSSLKGRARVVLIGGSEEEAFSRQLSRSVEDATDWTGALSLPELSAFLYSPRVKTLVSADSGPVHVAWLHGKPVVALYAKNVPGSDPARWGPRSARSVVIHKNMDEIFAEEVSSALGSVLA